MAGGVRGTAHASLASPQYFPFIEERRYPCQGGHFRIHYPAVTPRGLSPAPARLLSIRDAPPSDRNHIMKPDKSILRVRIPRDLEFSDLKLRRYPNGDVSFDHQVASHVLEASGVPLARITEDLYSDIITSWYDVHLREGGAPDPIMDELIAEDAQEQQRE